MATTENSYTKSNSNGPSFTFTFPYIKTSDIKVFVDDILKTEDTHYEFDTATSIRFLAGHIPATGEVIKISRITDIDRPRNNFYTGSFISAESINSNFEQVIFRQQEMDNDAGATAAQGLLADSAIQPLDNVSELTNDANYITSAGAPVQSVNTQTGAVALDADDIDDTSTLHKFATAAQLSAADSAVQPGDLATVATTGAYGDLSGTPTLGTAASTASTDYATTAQGTKADSALQSTDIGVSVQGYDANTVIDASYVATDENFTTADHSKLDGIEAGATADQTDAEIRAAVEAATDSNVFTDADHAKLNAIEAGATADQTAAEIKSLYESNSNTNEFNDGEKTKLAGIEAGATQDQTGSEIKSLYEGNTNTNAFTDAEKSKLAGIAAGAEVNVNANWNATSGDSQILNKPTLGTAAATASTDYATAAQGTTADSAVQPGDLATVATSGSYNDLTNKPTIPAAAPVDSVNSQTGAVVLDADDIDDTSTTHKFATAAQLSAANSAVQPGDLSTVATTGAYSDLSGTPTIPTNNNQLTNGAGYITSSSVPTNNNQLTNGAGYITGYTVTSSDVTQHEGDITITESQISDLGTYLTSSDLSSYATQSYVNTQVSNLVDSAPATLDTLNELAAALGDDANFSTTISNSIGTKMPLAGGTFTGAVTFASGQTFDYNNLTNTPTIPSNNNQLTNGAGYITSSSIPTNNNQLANGAGYITASSVPTNNNQLTNGAGYITAADIPADAVTSVNTQTGAVVLDTDDISEGSTNLYSQWDTLNSNIYYNSGNVGIGTSSPSGKLHIESAATTAGWQIRTDSVGLNNESGFYRDASDNYEVAIRNGSGGLSSIKNDGGASGASLRFYVQGADRLKIRPNGNVGINHSLPSEKFVVRASSSGNGLGIIKAAAGSSVSATIEATRDATDSAGVKAFEATTTGGNVFNVNYSGGAYFKSHVGIGTDTPSSKLHVVGDTRVTGNLLVHPHSGSTEGAEIQLKNPDGTTTGAVLDIASADTVRLFQIRNNSKMQLGHLNSSTSGTVELLTKNQPRIHIQSGGNVGIGTSNPSGKLHVESAATTAGWQFRTDSLGLNNESGFYRDSSDNYEVAIRNGSGGLSSIRNNGGATNANLRFFVQGSDRLTLLSNGNVGINTTEPEGALNVLGAGAAPSLTYDTGNLVNLDQGGIQLAIGVDTSSPFGGYLQARDSNNLARTISLNPVGGNVGVGTSNPVTKLDVFGDSNDSILPNNAIFKFKTTGGNGLYMGTRSSSPFQSYIQSAFQNNNNNNNPYSLLLNPEGGNVGIGTTNPAEILEAVANDPTVIIRDSRTSVTTARAALRLAESGASNSVDNYWDLVADNTAGNFGFTIKQGTVPRLAIRANNGNVGIGTTDPGAKLEVKGSTVLGAVAAHIKAGNGGSTVGLLVDGDNESGDVLIKARSNISASPTDSDTKFIVYGGGDVGIGTTAPGSFGKLAVRGGVAATGDSSAAFLTPGAGQGEQAALSLYGTFENTSPADNGPRRTADIVAGFNGQAWGGEFLSFNVGRNGSGNDDRHLTDPKMRITSNGNVGVNTTSPDAKFEVVNRTTSSAEVARFRTEGNTNNPMLRILVDESEPKASIRSSGSVASKLTLGVGNRDDITIATNGRVGIGTTQPNQKVEIRDANPRLRITDSNTPAASSTSYIEFFGSDNTRSSVIYTDTNGFNFQADSSGPNALRFLTNGGNERMRIDSSGNVRIGPNTALNQRLCVRGTSNDTIDETTGTAKFEGTGGNGLLFGTRNTSPFQSYIQSAFVQDTSQGQYNLLLNPLGGNVGIGTNNPAYKLQVDGGSLGTTANDTVDLLRLNGTTLNQDSLRFELVRTENVAQGVNAQWTTAAHKIYRRVDAVPMGYMQFGHRSSDLITFGEGNTEYVRIDGDGDLTVGGVRVDVRNYGGTIHWDELQGRTNENDTRTEDQAKMENFASGNKDDLFIPAGVTIRLNAQITFTKKIGITGPPGAKAGGRPKIIFIKEDGWSNSNTIGFKCEKGIRALHVAFEGAGKATGDDHNFQTISPTAAQIAAGSPKKLIAIGQDGEKGADGSIKNCKLGRLRGSDKIFIDYNGQNANIGNNSFSDLADGATSVRLRFNDMGTDNASEWRKCRVYNNQFHTQAGTESIVVKSSENGGNGHASQGLQITDNIVDIGARLLNIETSVNGLVVSGNSWYDNDKSDQSNSAAILVSAGTMKGCVITGNTFSGYENGTSTTKPNTFIRMSSSVTIEGLCITGCAFSFCNSTAVVVGNSSSTNAVTITGCSFRDVGSTAFTSGIVNAGNVTG